LPPKRILKTVRHKEVPGLINFMIDKRGFEYRRQSGDGDLFFRKEGRLKARQERNHIARMAPMLDLSIPEDGIKLSP
jgi:hypothetical protein